MQQVYQTLSFKTCNPWSYVLTRFAVYIFSPLEFNEQDQAGTDRAAELFAACGAAQRFALPRATTRGNCYAMASTRAVQSCCPIHRASTDPGQVRRGRPCAARLPVAAAQSSNHAAQLTGLDAKVRPKHDGFETTAGISHLRPESQRITRC